jgi:hypothetical protein
LDSDGCYYYRIWVEIDGKKVRASEKEEAFRLYFKNWGQLCRLFAIGFRQPEGEDAVFSHLQIREKARGTVLYDDPKVYTLTGDGKLNTWYPGAEISAPMLRKTFSLSGRVKSARLYATARGIYEMYLNGRPVAEDFLSRAGLRPDSLPWDGSLQPFLKPLHRRCGCSLIPDSLYGWILYVRHIL